MEIRVLGQGWRVYGSRPPKWQAGSIPWHAALADFSDFYTYFVRPASLYCAEHVCTHRTCVYTHVLCVHTVCELPLLANNTGVKHFYINPERVKCWLDIYHWGASLAITGRIRDIGNMFYNFLFKQKVAETPVTAIFSSLFHSSGSPLLLLLEI